MLSDAWIYHMFCNSTDDMGKMDPYQKTAFESEELQRLNVLIANHLKFIKNDILCYLVHHSFRKTMW